MALARYVITSAVTVPAGTAATLAAGEPGTEARLPTATPRSAPGMAFPADVHRRHGDILDPAGALYGAIALATCAPTSRARTTWATRL